MSDKIAEPKDHRFKVIVVATVAAALIISIGVWAITSAINSTKTKTETAKIETSETTKTPETTESTDTAVLNPATDSTTVSSPASEYTAPAVAANTNDIPKTGPTDVIISAIALGVIVSLILVNIDLVKRQAA